MVKESSNSSVSVWAGLPIETSTRLPPNTFQGAVQLRHAQIGHRSSTQMWHPLELTHFVPASFFFNAGIDLDDGGLDNRWLNDRWLGNDDIRPDIDDIWPVVITPPVIAPTVVMVMVMAMPLVMVMRPVFVGIAMWLVRLGGSRRIACRCFLAEWCWAWCLFGPCLFCRALWPLG